MLAGLAWMGAPALEPPADPTSSDYIPRPEWYFLGLFQLLKYFPGRLEIIGALVIPGVVMLFLVLLPWIDRTGPREWRARRLVLSVIATGLGGGDRAHDARRDGSAGGRRRRAGTCASRPAR